MAELSIDQCRQRRARFVECLAASRIDAVLIHDVRDIYYFTGTLLPADLPAVLVLESTGQVQVTAPAEFDVGEVDNHFVYEWHHRGTKHPDIVARMLHAMVASLSSPAWRTIGLQMGGLSYDLHQAIASFTIAKLSPIDETLAAMQRSKDPDEVLVLRASIAANMAAYDAVAREIRPGITELEILSAGRRGATNAAGEKLFHDGDYQSGGYNGPARCRAIEKGELYIVDAWTCYRGYWSDMARTFLVGKQPTEIQQKLFVHIRWVLEEAGKLLRPGTDGRAVYQAMDEMIRQHPTLADAGLTHHGGHAIGLRIHEMPDINLKRGGVLEAGNVICLEPGGYFAEARFGVRLENMFLVTPTGGENLCPGPIQLLECGC